MYASARICVAALLSGIGGAACATSSAPPGYLPSVQEAQTSAYGGWVDMTLRSAGEDRHVAGELIAASSDTLWVLPSQGHVTAVATQEVISGQLEGYDSRYVQVAGGVVLGTISTISNGVFLVFTAPMWVIGGTAAASSQSKVAIKKLPALRWEDVAFFARFPQGMPDGLALRELRPKG